MYGIVIDGDRLLRDSKVSLLMAYICMAYMVRSIWQLPDVVVAPAAITCLEAKRNQEAAQRVVTAQILARRDEDQVADL